MKKFLTLIIAAGMLFSAANAASAVEMKVSGEWMTSFTFADNMYNNTRAEDNNIKGDDGSFKAAHRIRINLDMVASENLSGRVQLQVASGTGPNWYEWGTSGVGGAGNEVTARVAYLDWMIPTTDVLVRMGRQEVAMPSYTFGSSVMDDVVDGVVVNAPINDMVGVTVGWLRPVGEAQGWGRVHHAHSNLDLAFLSVDVAADGFKVTPWGMVGFGGSRAGAVYDADTGDITFSNGFDMVGNGGENEESITAYWVGLGGELTLFDPFKFTADFLYSGNDADKGLKRSGWYAALGAEMKTAYATPFLKGWYASGDDDDADGDGGRMLSVDQSGAFNASSIYFDANGLLAATPDVCTAAGTWGVQLGVKDVSFIEDLSHMLSVTYFKGTNHSQNVSNGRFTVAGMPAADGPIGYMTTEDSAVSIDFLTSYQIYENLTTKLLLAYLVTDFDKSVWGQDYENIFRGTLNFTYNF